MVNIRSACKLGRPLEGRKILDVFPSYRRKLNANGTIGILSRESVFRRLSSDVLAVLEVLDEGTLYYVDFVFRKLPVFWKFS